MASLEDLKHITPALFKQLHKLGLRSVQSLLLHFPIRYIDETKIVEISEVQQGTTAQVQGVVAHAEVSYKPRKNLVVQLEDATGRISLRFLHFYPSTVTNLAVGEQLRVLGEVRQGFFGYEMVHPTFKKVKETTILPTELTPVYSTIAGLGQSRLRKAIEKTIAYCLQDKAAQAYVAETLPSTIYQLPNGKTLPRFVDCIQNIHAPDAQAKLVPLEDKTSPYWQRLAYDELLAQQLSMRKHYQKRKQETAPQFLPSETLVTSLLKALPFTLTDAQQKVALEIQSDLNQPHPMQRLLQGDVGSGKTIVACMASLQAVESGYQVALMAPTEILAEQHYLKFKQWLTPLNVHVEWLIGNQKKAERTAVLEKVAAGVAQVVIGTHAIFQSTVAFKQLGLSIIDEQHRFGVEQRLALRNKGQNGKVKHGQFTHQLMMSATPIPRTLSMSYYADLDVSVIDALPPGRTAITTKLIADNRREAVLASVLKACEAGQQVYWVCPLIEESEALQLVTATDTFENLQQHFPALAVRLLHGKMKSDEKKAVMADFSAGKTQLLVATTVIEVGVDVPNASLMVIEHAERMGLSQLHQLRGRVGRGAAKSTCVLLYQSKLSDLAKARLKVIFENNDGFAIAAEDLKIRGPGEMMGVKQSGVPMLKIADLERDIDLLAFAKQQADALLKQQEAAVTRHLDRWLGMVDEYIKV